MRAGIAVGLCSALIALAGWPAHASETCSAIADPRARLACYDAKNGAPSAPAGSPAVQAEPVLRGTLPGVRPEARALAQAAPLGNTGRVASVRPAPHAQWLIILADGRSFETTQTVDPPLVGDEIHFRKSLVGTKFLDIRGRQPITVRPIG